MNIKEETLKDISNFINEQISKTNKSGTSLINKVERLNVYYNLFKYVSDYDELEEVLRNYYAAKHKEEKSGGTGLNESLIKFLEDYDNDKITADDKDDYMNFRI